MDITTDTEAVCEQVKEELLEMYDVIFCNIEPKDSSYVIDACIPKTDADFAVCINADQTFAVVRVNPDAASKALLSWVTNYLQSRGFTLNS